MKAKFKVLTYAGVFVDESRLHNGIYEKSIPTLYWDDENMDRLIRRAERNIKFTIERYEQKYLDNLKQCALETVELWKIDSQVSNNPPLNSGRESTQ